MHTSAAVGREESLKRGMVGGGQSEREKGERGEERIQGGEREEEERGD